MTRIGEAPETMTFKSKPSKGAIAAFFVGTATVIGSIGTWWPILFPPATKSAPQFPPVIQEVSSSGSTDLGIIDADANLVTHQMYFMHIIHVATEYFYNIKITVRNKTGIEYKGCTAEIRYSGKNTRFPGVLFHGFWTDYYEKTGGEYFFKIAADPTDKISIFEKPAVFEREPGPPDWMRVRFQCTKPNVQVTPWHDVDTTHPY